MFLCPIIFWLLVVALAMQTSSLGWITSYWGERSLATTYFDHILSWWAHRDSPNILFLKYEDIKKDLPEAITKIAAFLRVDLPGDVVMKIADLTTFANMKADNTANMTWIREWCDKGTWQISTWSEGRGGRLDELSDCQTVSVGGPQMQGEV